MSKLTYVSKAWGLLTGKERILAVKTLGVLMIAALFAAIMVGSILPFLSVLSQPETIHTQPVLSMLYERGGFTSDYGFLLALGVASILVISLANLIQVLRVHISSRFAAHLMHSLSRRLLMSYLAQPYTFFLQNHTGDMATQVLSETEQVVRMFFRPLAELISSSLTVLAVLSLLLWAEPIISIIAIVGLGVIYGSVLMVARRYAARHGLQRKKANAQRFRTAQEALSGVKDIKLLGRERAYLDTYSTHSRLMADSIHRVRVVSQTPQFFLQSLSFGGIILICLVLLDPSSLGTGGALGKIFPVLGLFAFAGQRLIPEFSKLYQNMVNLTYAQAAIDATYDDLTRLDNYEPLPRSMPEPLGLKKDLVLDRVVHAYHGADRPGLDGMDLTIRAGERIGIVGTTGAGKTTLANLVLGVIRPTGGRLVVDGREVTDDMVRSWQQSVGYVPQDIFLADATVAQNIALGIPADDIDEPKLRGAAKIAQLDQFVTEELPDGYGTEIGERGVRLSGGQRQRIGIARALYHDANLIVFDEATSALDNLTERSLMTAIDALPGSKTVMMIAHRLSTVRNCDRIILLKYGRVEAIGPWDDLIRDSADFRTLASTMESA